MSRADIRNYLIIFGILMLVGCDPQLTKVCYTHEGSISKIREDLCFPNMEQCRLDREELLRDFPWEAPGVWKCVWQ